MKISKKNKHILKKLHNIQSLDEFKPNIHLMPYSGLINDPNGLCFINGRYHILYQWSPFTANHGLKHWGHYSTKDFNDFTHHGVAITPSIPEDNGGAISGSAFVENDIVYIFYSGNECKEVGEERVDCPTILVKMDKDGVVSENKKVLFRVDTSKYTTDFRDPFCYKRDSKYYLMFGGEDVFGKGVVSIYSSRMIDSGYMLEGNLEFSTPLDLGKMVECPSTFTFDGQDVLIVCLEKIIPNSVSEKNPFYIVGQFDNNNALFHNNKQLQLVDWGFEYYAPQVLRSKDRNLVLAWLGNMDEQPQPSHKYQWANTLTFPRDITIKDGWVYQQPVIELEKLRIKEVPLDKVNGGFTIENKLSYELLLTNQSCREFTIALKNAVNENIIIEYKDNTLTLSREDMTFLYYPEPGFIRKIENIDVEKIRIYFDVSILEIYINDGMYTMTGRYYVRKANQISVIAAQQPTLYKLKNLRITYL